MSKLLYPKFGAGSMQTLRMLSRNMMVLEKYVKMYSLGITEIAALITALGLDRKYIDELALTTYTNWSHVSALAGYSIWKHAVSTFSDDDANMMYVDTLDESIYNVLPQILEYQGAASSETASYFDYIYFYNGASFSTNYGGSGGDLSEEGGTSQTILEDTADFLYLGDASTFEGITFSMQTFGISATLDVEYWNGSAWTALSFDVNGLVDNTTGFTSDGRLKFDAPGDWATVAVNSQTKYWIRISTSTALTVDPVCYAILPEDSVITMLRLSSNETAQERWAWCYYDGYLYVTIPNIGNGNYEGIQWINSNSNATNLQNFFTYRNNYKVRYKDSTWPAAVTGRVGSSTFNGTTGREITHSLGHQLYVVLVTPTADPAAGFYWWITKSDDTVLIKCNGVVSTAFDYRIEVY